MQHASKFFGMNRLNVSLAFGEEKILNTFMEKILDYWLTYKKSCLFK